MALPSALGTAVQPALELVAAGSSLGWRIRSRMASVTSRTHSGFASSSSGVIVIGPYSSTSA